MAKTKRIGKTEGHGPKGDGLRPHITLKAGKIGDAGVFPRTKRGSTSISQ